MHKSPLTKPILEPIKPSNEIHILSFHTTVRISSISERCHFYTTVTWWGTSSRCRAVCDSRAFKVPWQQRIAADHDEAIRKVDPVLFEDDGWCWADFSWSHLSVQTGRRLWKEWNQKSQERCAGSEVNADFWYTWVLNPRWDLCSANKMADIGSALWIIALEITKHGESQSHCLINNGSFILL